MGKKIKFPHIFVMSLLCLLSPNLARTLKKYLTSASFKKNSFMENYITFNVFLLKPSLITLSVSVWSILSVSSSKFHRNSMMYKKLQLDTKT